MYPNKFPNLAFPDVLLELRGPDPSQFLGQISSTVQEEAVGFLVFPAAAVVEGSDGAAQKHVHPLIDSRILGRN